MCDRDDSHRLSREEERDLVQTAKDGDQAAKARLYEAVEPWIWELARRYDLALPELEDLVQEAALAFFRALPRFDPSMDCRLSTFVGPHLRAAMRREADRQDPLPPDFQGGRIHSLGETVDQNGEPITLEEREPDHRPSHQADTVQALGDRRGVLQEAVEDLPNHHPYSRVLTLRYGLNGGDPMTQTQVAEEVGHAQSYVSRLERRAMSLLAKLAPQLEPYLDTVGTFSDDGPLYPEFDEED